MGRKKGGEYDRQRLKAFRNLAYHIGRAGLMESEGFSLSELSDQLYKSGRVPVRFSPSSITRYLRRYFDRYLESPLLRTEREDYWRVNTVMYRARPPPAKLKPGPSPARLELTEGRLRVSEQETDIHEDQHGRQLGATLD